MNSSTSEHILLNMLKNPANKIIFSWYDYIIFIATLALSTLIGIYFGCFGSKQSTTYEYLMANKAMKPMPVALSLVASHISATTVTTIPMDSYRYGAYYFLEPISMVLQAILNICIFLPVYFNVEITSIFEYLEKRFDRRVKLLGSFIFLLETILILPIIIYTTVLVCSAVIGMNTHLLLLVISCVCIVYTSISGLKGVIWTDALQFVIMLGTMIFVFVLSVKSSGGLSTVWNKAVDGQRLDIFDLDLDPTRRMSIWTFIFGNSVIRLALNSVTQGSVQKYMSLPTFRDAIYCVIFYTIGMCVVSVGIVFFGLAIYAKYSDCDLLTTKTVSKRDQLVPYFILDMAGKTSGLSGLFTAGIVSAGLSTLSASWNALAGTLYVDFLKKRLNPNMSEKTGVKILKLLIIIEGILCICGVYLIGHFKEIYPLIMSFMSLAFGPMLGIFSLGVLFPRANSKGAFYGTLIGLIFGACMIFPSTYFRYRGWIRYNPKPLSTAGCQFFNSTVTVLSGFNNNQTIATPSVPSVFKISFMYYGLIGAVVTVVLGFIISCITSENKEPIDRSLISPVSRFLLPKTVNNVYYKKVGNVVTMTVKDSNEMTEEDDRTQF